MSTKLTERLTDFAVKNAPLPERGTVTLWDESLKGFGCRISQGGTRTFIVLIDSGRRQALGRWPLLSLAAARDEARRVLAEKTLGRIRPVHTAFDDAKDEYLAECALKNRPRTVSDYRRLLKRHYDFGRKGVGAISPRAILRNLSGLKPSERHHAFVCGRIFFTWCVRQHIIDRSPMETMHVPARLSSRERLLTDAELVAIYRTALNGTSAFHHIVALLVQTGQRRGEIAALEWAWCDLEKGHITLPASVTKNRRASHFPIMGATVELLSSLPRFETSPYVFPASRAHVRGKPSTVFNGWGKAKDDFDKELNGTVAPWTLHDLRRAYSSGLAALGVQQTVVEKLLNHISGGTQSPIAQVYNRYSFLPEMREAVARWEAKLEALRRS
jgi:integrase